MSRPVKDLLHDLLSGRYVAPDAPVAPRPSAPKPVHRMPPTVERKPDRPVAAGRCKFAQNGQHKWRWSKGVKSCWLCEEQANDDERPSWHRKVYGGGK